MKYQEYGIGDQVIVDGRFKCVVTECGYDDETNEWYYEVKPTEFESFPREVTSAKMTRL